MLFCRTEITLYCLFSLTVELFHPCCVPDILADLHIFFPYVTCYDLYMILTLCALRKVRAVRTYIAIALVFSVTISVSRSIFPVSYTHVYMIVKSMAARYRPLWSAVSGRARKKAGIITFGQ